MARIDKYEPKSGGFRAVLGFAPAAGDVGKPIPVELNGSGRVIKAALNSAAVRGVICMPSLLSQGDPVDVMTDGELVDVSTDDVTGAVAGVEVKAGAAGALDVAGTGDSVGWMVENWRLIVRLGRAS